MESKTYNYSLAGAVFEVRNSSGSFVKNVSTRVSNSGGFASVDVPSFGTYAIREITPPAGYVLNNTKIPFTITEDLARANSVVTSKHYNEPEVVEGSAKLIKKEIVTGKPLQGAVEANNTASSSISLNEVVESMSFKMVECKQKAKN